MGSIVYWFEQLGSHVAKNIAGEKHSQHRGLHVHAFHAGRQFTFNSSLDGTQKLLAKTPGAHYRVFGDEMGNKEIL